MSHALPQVRDFTDKAMWIQYGELKAFGPTEEIADDYQNWNKWFNGLSKTEKKAYQEEQKQKQISFSEEQLEKNVANDSSLSDDEKRQISAHLSVGDVMPLPTWILFVVSMIGTLFFIYQYAMWG